MSGLGSAVWKKRDCAFYKIYGRVRAQSYSARHLCLTVALGDAAIIDVREHGRVCRPARRDEGRPDHGISNSTSFCMRPGLPAADRRPFFAPLICQLSEMISRDVGYSFTADFYVVAKIETYLLGYLF